MRCLVIEDGRRLGVVRSLRQSMMLLSSVVAVMGYSTRTALVVAVVGVVAPLDKSPQMIFWDPATYPNGFKTVADLKEFAKTGNKIYVGSIKQTFGKYLVDQGVPAR